MKRYFGFLLHRLSDFIYDITFDETWERHYIVTGEYRRQKISARIGEYIARIFYDMGTRLRHDS
jgi:hypothetical protein